MNFFGKKEEVNKPEPMAESFSMFNGVHKGKPLLASINMSAKKYKYKKNFSWFLGISIEFKKPEGNGLASGDELKAMEKFEDKLVELIESKNETRYIGASNWNNHRELLFYTTEPKELAPLLQKMMNSSPEWNFNFTAYHDPNWKAVSMFLK